MRYFIAVSEERSLTSAAKKLGITQPALSKCMKDLEGELGVGLFIRGGKGTVLTEAGMTLYQRSKEVVSVTEKAKDEVISVGMSHGCDIHVSLGESPNIEDLSRAFVKVRERLPASRLHLHTDNMDGIRWRMETRMSDIGIMFGPVDEDDFEGFETGRRARFGLLIRRYDPLCGKDGAAIEDLEGRRVIALRGSEYSEAIPEWLREALRGATTASYNLVNNVAAMVAVTGDAAVTVDWLAELVSGKGLEFLPFVPEATVGTSVVWLKGRKLSSSARALVEEMRPTSARGPRRSSRSPRNGRHRIMGIVPPSSSAIS